MSAKFDHIKVDIRGAVARITVDRPEVLNALNLEVVEELEEALVEHIDPVETRVIVFEGSGDKAFIAGADVAAMSDMSPEMALAFAQQGQALSKALESLPQITIAKVQGFALGGGCELAMACDLIIASRDAKFGQPEVNLGLIPGFGGTQRLARRVGLPVALDMLCCGSGRTLSGEEAFRVGLVSRVVDKDKLEGEVERAIKAVLKAGPCAVSEVKRLARESYGMSLEAGLSSEASSFANCFGRDESKEGISAFLEKRSANFTYDS